MKKITLFRGLVVLAIIASFLLILMVATAQDTEPDEAALIERGAYIVRIARCVACHTPTLEEFTAEELTKEQEITLALYNYSTLDVDSQFLAGGNRFNLGPAGTVFASNLTSDEATGLGAWSDEEIETALRIGVAPDGRRLHPIMPYNTYYSWPQSDIDALIAYLRTVPAIENEVDRTGPEGEGEIREMPTAEDVAAAPSEDLVELGEYLVVDVMRCTGCHTPRDATTGLADTTMLMGGGQAFEREFGIVYGGNITPHEATGIGAWEDEDIARVFREGVRIDGRRLVLMPWQDYSIISDEDLEAVIAYMHALEPIDNEVPNPAFEDEAFMQFVDED
jgi:mono/diheme cytochrome c family protein